MFLKRIELEGFKSFADRTVIHLDRGLTGIVGPNGCGKSNVVDALLWVTGERSARVLRADAMEDVIFKGSESRPMAPYAMVEIVLEDEAGRYEVPGGEVVVGRRLFRTGESEFLLGGRRVRRKDVRNVLLDTGLGVRAYMILVQGKIDAVLAANPADRRQVFEEAAGVSRYKQRRHETSLKLERSAQDLARVEDVLEEVRRRVRSLRVQAGKARRFLESRDRYRELRLRLAVAEEVRLREAEAALRRRQQEVEAQVAEMRQHRQQAEDEERQLAAEEEALRSRQEALRGAASESRQEAAAREERARGLEARAATLDEQRVRNEERAGELSRETESRGGLSRELGKRLEELVRRAQEQESDLEAAAQAFAAVRDRRRAALAELEALRRAVLEGLQVRSSLQNEVAGAAARGQAARSSLASLARRQATLARLREEAGREARASAEALEGIRAAAARVQEQAEERARSRAALLDRCRRAEEDAAGARKRVVDARARLEALAAVDAGQEGLPPGAAALLAASPPPPGLGGLLLEGVEVPPPWDRLVESLLGQAQHALWWTRPPAGTELEGAGTVDLAWDPGRSTKQAEGGLRPLAALLGGDPARCRALGVILAGVRVAEDAGQARRLAAEHPGLAFLCPEGELHRAGHARLGLLDADGGAGLLARRNAREAAARDLAAAAAEEKELQRLFAVAREELESCDAEAGHAEQELRRGLAERERAEARVQEIELRVRGLEENARALAEEAALLESEIEEVGRLEAAKRKALEAEEAGHAARRRELQEAEAAAALLEREYETAQAALQERREDASRLAGERRHLEDRREEGMAAIRERQEELGRLAREQEELEERAARLRAEAETERRAATAARTRQVEQEERAREASVQTERVVAAREALRRSLEGEGGRVEEALERRQELALEIQRVQLGREMLLAGLVEEFHQALEDLARGAGLQPGRDPFESDEERAAAAEELAGLRRRLESLGSVNLEAVAELQVQEERLAFLERERADLSTARMRLEETLEELDRTCRERFLETFTAVRGHFEAIFRRLFQGGRAELNLQPEVDPLVAGIEIQVRPPGKQLRSINLLSGGERTLTALALLLGVFRSRPSPFCLLDEVDAALDDANVGRFLEVLREFTRDTQFLVVTHNKMTMSHCERLFGVTMRKAGISMVVGVDLAGIPEHAPGRPRLETAAGLHRLDGAGAGPRQAAAGA